MRFATNNCKFEPNPNSFKNSLLLSDNQIAQNTYLRAYGGRNLTIPCHFVHLTALPISSIWAKDFAFVMKNNKILIKKPKFWSKFCHFDSPTALCSKNIKNFRKYETKLNHARNSEFLKMKKPIQKLNFWWNIEFLHVCMLFMTGKFFKILINFACFRKKRILSEI